MAGRFSFSALWGRITGMGGDGDHGLPGSFEPRAALPVSQIELLLDTSQIARNAVEAMPEDIIRAWRLYDKEQAAWITAEEKFEIRSVAEQALIFSEAFGGAIVMPRYDENVVSIPDLAAPKRKVRAKSLLGFRVFAPQELSAPSDTKTKIDPVTGLPSHVELKVAANGKQPRNIRIHSSWLHPVFGPMRYTRNKPMSHSQTMFGVLGQSRLDLIFDDITRLLGGLQNLSHLLVKANIDVLQLRGLADAMKDCRSEEERHKALSGFLDIAGYTLKGANVYQPMIIDSDEKLERHGLTSGNPVASVSLFLDMLVASSRIPRSRLLGEQAKGLSNGGEADNMIYYDRCSSMRERRLTGLINFTDAAMRDDQGLPELLWDYKPLWEMNDAQKAEIDAKNAEIDTKYAGLDIPFIVPHIVKRLADSGRYPFTEQEIAQITETFADVDLDDVDEDDLTPEPVEAETE